MFASVAALDDRFQELRQLVDQEIARARAEVIGEISKAVSRIRAASSEEDWHEAVLDSGRAFANEPAALELLASLAAITAPAAMVPAAPVHDAAARRFARVKVAEIQLYHAAAVRAGRAARDLYGSLKLEIDAARDGFRKKFLSNGNTSDDLHAEIVHALANDDATLLGPAYPGPLA